MSVAASAVVHVPRECRRQSDAQKRKWDMHFNPAALLVFVAFCVLLIVSLSSGSSATHAAEAAVTVLIALGLGGYYTGGRRNRAG
jgi:protein-S-isoprenylcysteine O-methyltransferase Ste14